MIVHIAIYKWKEGVTAEAIEQAMEDVRSLKDKVDGLLEVRCGENFSIWNEGYSNAFVVFAKDRAALDAYRNHPDHVSVAKRIDVMDGGSIGIDFEDPRSQ